jgi:hypothetical protein
MAKKPKYKAEGLNFTPQGGFSYSEFDYSLPGTPASPRVAAYGKPITQAAHDELVRLYKSKNSGQTEHVTFSKEAILTILAQNGCEGIRFVFCQSHQTQANRITLIMAGVNGDGDPLKSTELTGTEQETLMMEEGTGWPPW